MARLRIFTAALAAAVLAGCAARPDPGKTGALLNALQNTAALTDYAVVSHTVMEVGNGQDGDGLSVTQRFWRTGEDAMQKMTACDAAGAALFENGAALLDGVYYWYDGETWTPDTTGMAAAANLNWVPKVTWPESTGGFTLQQKGDTYTVTFRPSAFPSLIQAQVDALSAEADALRRQGFPEEAAAREAQRDSAARAEYKALRYTIQVEGDRAVNCTTYSKVVQPSVAGLDAAGIEAQQMVTNEITYTWQLTGTDPDQIRAILAEVTADARS